MANLIDLDLLNNQLVEFPAEINKLTNLTHLDLQINRLTVLSPQISNLGKLKRLYISGNQLTQLTPEIGKLTNLTSLYLFGNRLTELPSEIGNLTNLTRLCLFGNQLNSLPIELLQLSNLIELYLHNNEELGIPPEILGPELKQTLVFGSNKKAKTPANPADILEYYFRTLQEPSLPLNQAKVILVGEGKVGKTSLLNRLIDNEFNAKEDQTKGIEIRRWPIQLENEEINLNVWDFGGQEIMHATHQFFLTKRSIYVLVLDSRQSAEANRLEYWLRMIQSFGGDSPVIVVCNQCDQQAMDLNWTGLKAKYPFIKDFVRQASCKKNVGIEEVKKKIQGAVTGLPHIKDLVPKTWFHIKDSLEDQKENGLDCLSIDDYRSLCTSKLVTEETDQDLLVNFLNDLGVMLHYGDHQVLCDLNILNPQWVTQGVYAIINHPDLLRKRNGIVTLADLEYILDKKRYPAHRRRFIADMMCKFELCYSFGESQNDTYMVPSLLSENEQDTGAWDGALGLQYKYDPLPAGIISRFIVRMHAYISQNTYWKNGVVLISENGKNRALVKADPADNLVAIQVNGEENGRRAFLELIRADFRKIHASPKREGVKELVPLPNKPKVTVSYQHLVTLEKAGLEEFIPEGTDKIYSVKPLLDGVEAPQDRTPQEMDDEKEFLRDVVKDYSGHLRRQTLLTAKVSSDIKEVAKHGFKATAMNQAILNTLIDAITRDNLQFARAIQVVEEKVEEIRPQLEVDKKNEIMKLVGQLRQADKKQAPGLIDQMNTLVWGAAGSGLWAVIAQGLNYL